MTSGWQAEVRDGMRVLWDVSVPMDDGQSLSADVFLPVDERPYPLIMAVTAYGKNLPFSQGYREWWDNVVEHAPEVLERSTTHYISFEAPDPEVWVADGYALMIVDARGCGRSPGVIENLSPRESKDFFDCVEWAADQPWCTGKVGMLGMSYLGFMQWFTASRRPPHLAAICPWEALDDTLRQVGFNGGIPGDMLAGWTPTQVRTIQYGLADQGYRNEFTGVLASGDEELSSEEREGNASATEVYAQHMAHPLEDDFYEWRHAHWEDITIPLLSVGSWGSVDIHTRGNLEGFMNAASEHKWLVMRKTDDVAGLYSEQPMQRRFFDWALKGEGDWLETQPRVMLAIRGADDVHTPRAEAEYPLARTEWTKFFLRPDSSTLSTDPPEEATSNTYRGFGEGLTLRTGPFRETTEVTGPLACKLWISTSTSDADLFLVIRLFDPDGEEVLFNGLADPQVPVTKGWLRASHRALDPEKSLPYRPFHHHRTRELLTPGEVYETDIEIVGTSIVIPAEYSLGLSILGRDYDHGKDMEWEKWGGKRVHGCSLFTHTAERYRSREVYDGEVTIHSSPTRPSYLLAPVIP